jgi:FeS assembly SUF system protein
MDAIPSPTREMKEKVIEVLRTVRDPELGVNIYDLGLIYDILVQDTGVVTITMTLTTPTCPIAALFIRELESKIKGIPGVLATHVVLVWDPPWDQSMMSESAKLQLNIPLFP